MNRHIGTLLTILIIQCGLVATLYWPHSEKLDTDASKPLLPLDPDTIDEIYVEDEQGNEAVLLMMSGHWLLPDLEGMPIDTQMVEKLIDSISHRAGEWPVATTASSRQRFQVAAYHFQRRISLIGNGELLGTIYLGTSPGFRKVHARNDDGEAIYSIPYNVYDAPANNDAWLDKALLQIPDPLRISSADYTVTKQGTGWVSAQGTEPDSRELSALLLGLRSLQIEGIADADMQRTLAIAAADLRVEIETADGTTSLALFTVGEQNFISSSAYNFFFTLSAYDFDRLSTINGSALNPPGPEDH